MIIRTNTTELNIILLITASRMVYKCASQKADIEVGKCWPPCKGLVLAKDWFLILLSCHI